MGRWASLAISVMSVGRQRSKSSPPPIFERNVQSLKMCPHRDCPGHWISDNYTCPILDSTIELFSDESTLNATEIIEYPHSSLTLPCARSAKSTRQSRSSVTSEPGFVERSLPHIQRTRSLSFFSYSDLVDHEVQPLPQERVCSANTLLMTKQRQLSEPSLSLAS
ncbi:hypothetical protein OGAPHI_005237 [Ogataea philodendri]|uniref:Uncharacterized protein n=1 Tax=Ogataea philodendri TaxID=1378263 RepID=A0A9P8P2F4_9ASCO|nr:uncharacterized protein OGAPHI_005237 [Ogataea philodendri]KAH3663834.1 hypothetical protein OGAPHI_005237 [Ogataea philodendri]